MLRNSVSSSIGLVEDSITSSAPHEDLLPRARLVQGTGHRAKNRTKLLSSWHFPLGGLRETMYKIISQSSSVSGGVKHYAEGCNRDGA